MAEATEIQAELEALGASTAPYLIGVRHHSPALAARVERLLNAFQPDEILVELPGEFDTWLAWLGHEGTLAPVALAAVPPDGEGLVFYPFADFSPELAAVRWAIKHKVPVRSCDLHAGHRLEFQREANEGDGIHGMAAVNRYFNVDGFDDLWDRAVEARAPGESDEAIRRAGLYLGWALRRDAFLNGTLPLLDAVRETQMRAKIAEAGGYSGKKVAVVVGAFHAPALLKSPQMLREAPLPDAPPKAMVTSLIPYAFELLDSRSMYPAGIRDPMWQQRVMGAMHAPQAVADLVSDVIVTICRDLRSQGHVAGVPDAAAAAQMAHDLAGLRGLPAPGRQEILESIQSAMARGEIMGRGRILAKAVERVMVGRARGALADGCPRSGLYPHVLDLLSELALPGPGVKSTEPLRLDPLRSERDMRRHVTLERLSLCGIPYAKETAGRAIGATETLTRLWEIAWEVSTDAMLELAGVWGVTLEQATRGAIRWDEARERQKETWDARAMLGIAEKCARAALPDMTAEAIERLHTDYLPVADLRRILAGLQFLEAVHQGHFPGLEVSELSLKELPRAAFLGAAIRACEGILGSDDTGDVADFMEVVALAELQPSDDEIGTGRLIWLAETMSREGTPTMQGAGLAARMVMGRVDVEEFGNTTVSWAISANNAELRAQLSQRLRGLLVAASSLLENDATLLRPLADHINTESDEDFLASLPALRAGFDVLSAAGRDRLFTALADVFPDTLDPRGHTNALVLPDDPTLLASWKVADEQGRRAAQFFLNPPRLAYSATLADAFPTSTTSHNIAPLERWQLILGREREKMSGKAGQAARALEQLYGSGRGEGSGGGLGEGGGKEQAFPTVREWAEELQALFGEQVREEVLGAAITQGYPTAALEIDGEHVTPSVELLESLLSLKGGMSESQLSHLRALIRRVVDALVKELAQRLRPALTGLATPMPTRRPGGPIDLKRTVRSNLDRVQRTEDGTLRVVPERIFFKTRAKKSLDWHVMLVVDVSGSMTPSVIYSAIIAAILQSLPSVSVSFYAFNTEVIDLSEHAVDPLALLLEVEVGGGTHIARALRYAREHIRVPNRTILALVTDFEEGWGVDGLVHEVRQIVESGVHALGLAALDDAGKPRYNNAIASLCVSAGMPVAALTPLEMARWVGEKVRGRS